MPHVAVRMLPSACCRPHFDVTRRLSPKSCEGSIFKISLSLGRAARKNVKDVQRSSELASSCSS